MIKTKMDKKGELSFLLKLILLLLVVGVAFSATYMLRNIIWGAETFTSCGTGSNYPGGSCQATCDRAFFEGSMSGLCDTGQQCCIPKDDYQGVLTTFNLFISQATECFEGSLSVCDTSIDALYGLGADNGEIQFENRGEGSVVKFLLDGEQAVMYRVPFKACVDETEQEYEITFQSGTPYIDGSTELTIFRSEGEMLCAANEE